MENNNNTNNLPDLHVCRVDQARAIINRVYAFLHLLAILALIYYRASSILLLYNNNNTSDVLAWVLIFASELLLSFIWLLSQAYRWRPVSTTVFPKRLPGDEKLPSIDVFICTADPEKEPTVEVMNTVISAMSLDYPPNKLSVYLSDDAGSPFTLYAIREAWSFAVRSWLPFCRVYGIKSRCPEIYFSEPNEDLEDTQFMEEVEKIKSKYEVFKERVERAKEDGPMEYSKQNHSPLIEYILYDVTEERISSRSKMVEYQLSFKNLKLNPDRGASAPTGTPVKLPTGNKETQRSSLVIHDDRPMDSIQAESPLLVYVSREKRSSHPHNFKAGALNVLLRVSAVLSNSPYILVLDCDMYCNDPTSARQAMCFHLDPKLSHSLSFVQFPQCFRNITKNDIYDSKITTIFKILWPGLNGLQGPILSGTCFYIKRKTLYGNVTGDIDQLKQWFGPSNDFIISLRDNYKNSVIIDGNSLNRVLGETRILATCTYQKHTQWGQEIGFLYHSLLEDYFTGFILHCRGWTSIYHNPSRPCFLGSATTNLSDTLVQYTRWQSGLIQVLFSRFCPLAYGLSRISLLQNMCYGYVACLPFYSLPLLCYATIPQLCLLNNIPLYPKVSNSWFIVFSIVYISSLGKHLSEVLLSRGSLRLWWDEQRIWMIKSVTSCMLGCLDGIMKWIGISGVAFVPTNKVVDKEQGERYELGVFDFQTSNVFLFVPLTTLTILNIESFVIGVGRVIVNGSFDQVFGQVFLSSYILIISYPIIEGMILRKDKGRVPTLATLLSVPISMVFLALGSTSFGTF